MKSLRTAMPLLILLLTASTSWASAPSGIEVHNPWVREAPPMATLMAAYFQLHNHGEQSYTLISVKSPLFQHIEIHRSMEQDGMASMAGVSQVMLPAHGKVSFEPGGLHVMMIRPSRPLKSGDKVPLIFTFDDGSTLDVEVDVRSANAMGDTDHGNSSHTHDHHTPAKPHSSHDHGH